MILTSYHEKIVEFSSDIVNHGWGSFMFQADTLKDGTTKVTIQFGKHHVFFVKKNIEIDKRNLL